MSLLATYLLTRLVHLKKIAYVFYGLGALTLFISIFYLSVIYIGFFLIILAGIIHVCDISSGKELAIILAIPAATYAAKSEVTKEWDAIIKDLVRSLVKGDNPEKTVNESIEKAKAIHS